MKPICSLVLLLFLLTPACQNNAPDVDPAPDDATTVTNPPNLLDPVESKDPSADPVIENIRQQFQRITELERTEQLRRQVDDTLCTRRDGELVLTRHYHDDALVLLEYTTGIGHEFTTTRVYYEGDTPVFVHIVNDNTGPTTVPESVDLEDTEAAYKSEVLEDRYYLDAAGLVHRHLRKSYSYFGWEDGPKDGSDVTNTEIEDAVGTRYGDLGRFDELRQGVIDC